MEDAESPEPLAALEILTEMNADEEKDLVEQFCCTQTVEEVRDESDSGEVSGTLRERRETVERVSRVREFESDRVSSVRETLERTESSEESEEESKVELMIKDPTHPHKIFICIFFLMAMFIQIHSLIIIRILTNVVIMLRK